VLVALFLYIGGYQIGFGPVSWLILSEIFPLHVRGEAIAMGVLQNFFWNLVVTFLFPILLDDMGVGPTFAIFTFLAIVALLFAIKYVPETKGLTLEEIEHFFTGRNENWRISSFGSPLERGSKINQPLLSDL